MKQTNKHQSSNAHTTITRNCSIHCEVDGKARAATWHTPLTLFRTYNLAQMLWVDSYNGLEKLTKKRHRVCPRLARMNPVTQKCIPCIIASVQAVEQRQCYLKPINFCLFIEKRPLNGKVFKSGFDTIHSFLDSRVRAKFGKNW